MPPKRKATDSMLVLFIVYMIGRILTNQVVDLARPRNAPLLSRTVRMSTVTTTIRTTRKMSGRTA